MAPLIVTILCITIFLFTLHTWRKLNDNSFLIPAAIGVPVILVSMWSMLNMSMLVYADLLLPLYLGIVSWYHWKRYADKLFMYGLIVAVMGVIYRVYQLLER